MKTVKSVLYGELTGRAWGGFDATLEIEVALTGRKLVDSVAEACKCGDFESCYFSVDSSIVISTVTRSKVKPNTWTTRERQIPIADFPSLKAYVEDLS